MAKTSPVVDENTRIDDGAKAKHKTDELIRRVQNDQTDQHEWLMSKLEWFERRFSRVDRAGASSDPWVGASTVWLPVSDLYIGRTTPFYMNALFGGNRVIRMKPVNAAAMEVADNASANMEHILRGGGVNSMPDLELQMSSIVDGMCTYGTGLVKTYYSYKTRTATETIRRDDLPGILQTLIIIPNMTEQERREQQARFPNINPPIFQAVFGTLDINPINVAKFNEISETLEREVVGMYGLDLDEKQDKVALEEIMGWLKSGTKDESVPITKREVLEDVPRIVNVPIQDLIVPPNTQLDFSRAERVTQRMWLSQTELQQMGTDEMWSKESLETAMNAASGTQDVDELTFALHDRAHDWDSLTDDESVEIWQTWHYEDVHGKGMPELVVSVYEPTSGALLRKMPFAPDHGKIPITALPFEITDQLFRSPRGIPEILDDIESHIGAWHRWLENNMLISSTTSVAVSRGSLENPNDIEPFPGMVLEVEDAQRDIAPIIWPSVQVPIERLESFYLQWPERLIGGMDTENLQQNSPERRTATEVSFIDQNRRQVLSQRGMIFLKSLEKPFTEVWQLWKQFGPKSAFVHITGEPPLRMTQHMTRGRFAVSPVAATGQHDPQSRQNSAANRLQVAMQVAPLIAGDVRGTVDIAQAFQDWLTVTDPLAAQRIWKPRAPEQQQEMMENQQASSERLAQLEEIAEKARVNAPITDEEAEILMKEIKSNPDIFPHGALQEVIQAARAAFQEGIDQQTLSGGQG